MDPIDLTLGPDEALDLELPDLVESLAALDEDITADLPALLASLEDADAIDEAPLADEAPMADAVALAGAAVPAAVPAVPQTRLQRLKGMLQRIEQQTRDAMAARGTGAALRARYLRFVIGGQAFAVPLSNLTEVGRVPAVVPLPHVKPWMLGLVSVRGHILSLVDLRGLLFGDAPRLSATDRMLVVRPKGGEIFGGLVVDAIQGIRDYPEGQIQPVAADGQPGMGAFVAGLCGDGDAEVVVLDIDRLLASDDVRRADVA